MPWRVAPQVRLELTTLRLTAECSAIELLRIIRGLFAARCLPPARSSASSSLLRSALVTASASLLARLPLAAPFFLMFESGKNFRSSRSPLDPGNFLLSQAVPSSVPSAFGGLTSVFGMGTGGALQLSSPETFLRGALPRFSSASLRSLRFRSTFSPLGSLPPPRTFKTAQVRVDQQTFTLFRLSLAFPRAPSASAAFTLAPARSSSSDQALDRLVSPSSTPHSASTDDLSTSSSLRGLTCLKQWQSSSSGGLHA